MSALEGCTGVAAELLAYGHELAEAGAAQSGGAFTTDADADAFIKREANAFLLGVLFTQGIPAERAWAAPWLLRQRLGHLDVERIAAEPDAVAAAIAQPPALHRFKVTLGVWVPAAAARLVHEYGGDASQIWPAGARVADVMGRLEAFAGVGRKKAAMAVELLTRHFGVRLEGRSEGRIAYDVQVRRVFLRSGLVDVDTPEAVERAAAQVCPEAPGTLDLPAWLVGRESCRPREPKCDACRLGAVCPRKTWLDAVGVGVRSAGPRVTT